VKLHSPQFENALKCAAKAALRRSPELEKEARRSNHSFRKHYSGSLVFRIVAIGVVGFFTWVIVSLRGNVAAALAFVTLWTFFLSFFRTESLLSVVNRSGDLSALSFLPIEKPLLLRWELQKYYRTSVMSLLDLIAGYGTIAVYLHSTAAMAATIPAAVLAWAVMHAMVLFCGSRWPHFPYGLIAVGAVFSTIALRFEHISAWFGEALHQLAMSINVLLPTGWTASLFLLFTGNHEWTLALLIIPITAVLSTIPDSMARLHARYNLTEATRPEASDVLPEGVEETSVATNQPNERPLHVDSDAVEPIVREHLFSTGGPWHEPAWPERILWRWWTPRERILAEFSFSRKVRVLAVWIKCFRNAGVTVLLALAVGLKSEHWESLILIIGLSLIYCRAVVQILASGMAFQTVESSGINMPYYATYGIGLRELSRLFLKYTAIQIPFLLLLSLLCGSLIAHFCSSPVSVGLIYGLKVAGLVISLRFVSLTFSFRSATNDNSRFRLKKFVFALARLTVVGLFFVFATAALFVPEATAAWILWLLAIVDAYVMLVVYGWFYNRKWFDLMSVPRR
jgi:hypothetical protein